MTQMTFNRRQYGRDGFHNLLLVRARKLMPCRVAVQRVDLVTPRGSERETKSLEIEGSWVGSHLQCTR